MEMAPVTHALRIEGLSKSFGGLNAVDGFDLTLDTGAIAGIIGPNGAGKSTIFNVITGIYRADTGLIWVGERDITACTADAITRVGIARTFQNIRLFQKMTAWDNVKMAFFAHTRSSFVETVLRLPAFHRVEATVSKKSLEYLEYFGLADRRDELAQNLSYGEQRRLEIARALATHAKILLLDEPAAGVNHNEIGTLIDFIRNIHKDFSLSIILIEHQMPFVMDLCEHVTVVQFGKTIADGTPAEVIRAPEVIRAYLGDAGEISA